MKPKTTRKPSRKVSGRKPNSYNARLDRVVKAIGDRVIPLSRAIRRGESDSQLLNLGFSGSEIAWARKELKKLDRKWKQWKDHP